MEDISDNTKNTTISERILDLEERLMDLLELRNYYRELPSLPFDLQIDDTLKEIEYLERIF